VQLYCRCFTVLHLVVTVLHYMFRPTWPSSGVYDVLLLYSWRNVLRCFCCLSLYVVILYTFPFVFLKYSITKIWWWAPQCSDTRMTVLVRAAAAVNYRPVLSSEWAPHVNVPAADYYKSDLGLQMGFVTETDCWTERYSLQLWEARRL
jgi:hypothetical protein